MKPSEFRNIVGDIFDIRDVIARFEEVESIIDTEREYAEEQNRPASHDADIYDEYNAINAFLTDVAGSGGDEQWRGDWYPAAFIADHRFVEYAREFAEDIGAIDRRASWPNNCIDWEAAATALQADYNSVEIYNTTYWYR